MIKVRVERAYSFNGYGIWIIKYDLTNNKTYISEPIEIKWKEIQEGVNIPQETLRIPASPSGYGEELLRAIVDGITEAGLAPATALPDKDLVKSMRDHIADLRTSHSALVHMATKT